MRSTSRSLPVGLSLILFTFTNFNASAAPHPLAPFASKQIAPESPRDAAGDAASLETIQLYKQGRYDEALSRAQTTILLREKAFGKNHELYAAALYNLATVQFALTQYEDARKGFEQTLKIQEDCGADVEQICNSLNKLANASYAVGRTIDAKKALEREISLREASDGSESPSLLAPLKNLAQVYEYQNEYEKSAQLYARRAKLINNHFQRKASPTDQEKNLFRESWEDCACAWRQARNKKEAQCAESVLEKLAGKKLFFFNTYEPDEDELVQRGKPTKSPVPDYPKSARAVGVSGDVIVRLDVDETGRVISVKVQCGHPLLRQASEEAARRWNFKPTLIDGKPESFTGFVTFRFLAPPGVKPKIR